MINRLAGKTNNSIRSQIWILIICLVYIAVNLILISYNNYYISIVPILLILVYWYFFSPERILILIALATPWSVNLLDFNANIGISLPSEPLMAGLMLLFILSVLHKPDIRTDFGRHPVTFAVLFYLVWMGISCLPSQYPIVSWKFFASQMWFIVPIYFFGFRVFQNEKNIGYFVLAYLISFFGVVVYTIIHHAMWDFAEQPAHWVMSPFYNDHTAYGAVLAMFLPLAFFYSFYKGYNRNVRFFSFLMFIILVIAIILSYSRAAWVSIAAAIAVLLIILYRIKTKWVVLGAISLVALFIYMRSDLIMKLEQNKQDSSSNLTEHLQSISNISTDASNMERLNRWNAALRIFADYPVFGSGPGTYQFVYAPYQLSRDRTIISTNAGDLGNAHSEYLGPLSESGLLGLISILAVIATAIFSAMRLIKSLQDKGKKYFALALLMGLITYITHGALNNFLDTDKASVPFWGFIVVLVSMDISNRKSSITNKDDRATENNDQKVI